MVVGSLGPTQLPIIPIDRIYPHTDRCARVGMKNKFRAVFAKRGWAPDPAFCPAFALMERSFEASPNHQMMSRFVLFLLFAAVVNGGTDDRHHGDGTAYSGDGEKDETGFNSCQFGQLDDRWERYYGALPSRSFDAHYCGECIRVRGTESDAPGDWVTIKIVDECANCKDGDVDMSKRALKESTGYAWDRKRIEWERVDCDEE